MIKPIKCSACGEGYNLDLAKYGGKKIKCKKCAAPIDIPTIAEANDEFEILGESTAPVAASLPAGLQRSRLASQRGSVNIALLQRTERSRLQIRNAFLALHGGEMERNAPLKPFEDKAEQAAVAAAEDEAILQNLKTICANAMACTYERELTDDHRWLIPTRTGKKFAGKYETVEQPDVEAAYQLAVRILGKPVIFDPPPPLPQEKPLGLWGSFKKFMSNGEEVAKNDRERAGKLATLKAAIEKHQIDSPSRKTLADDLRRQRDAAKAELLTSIRITLDTARSQIHAGQLHEADQELQRLIKTAPVDLLGQVLVALSQSAFLSNNPTAAARHIQDACCFGASPPPGADTEYVDLWAKANAGLPKE